VKNVWPSDSAVVQYVEIDEDRCNGCILCMKVCPTKAIRVQEGRVARVVGVCVDCAECIRVCPRGAIHAITTDRGNLGEAKYSVVSGSTVMCMISHTPMKCSMWLLNSIYRTTERRKMRLGP